jgi:hypothetical protein
MPFVPAAAIPPRVSTQSIVIDLVIVTLPKPPGSRQLISPLTAVFEIAPGKVLQGAVRLQGLMSSPTPETHVRLACASTGAPAGSQSVPAQSITSTAIFRMIVPLPLAGSNGITAPLR